MVENQNKNEITLRCKPLDPTDPTMLRCEIIPKSIPRENDDDTDPSPSTQQPDQSGSDTAKPCSVGSSDVEQQEYETLNVLRMQIDGKDFLKVLDPRGNAEPAEKENKPTKKTEPNLEEIGNRLSRLKKCNSKSCTIPRTTSLRQDRAVRRTDTDYEGRNSITPPGTSSSTRARRDGKTREGS